MFRMCSYHLVYAWKNVYVMTLGFRFLYNMHVSFDRIFETVLKSLCWLPRSRPRWHRRNLIQWDTLKLVVSEGQVHVF